MKDLETMQREGREKAREIVPIGFPDTTKRAFEMSEEDLGQHTINTWKAAQESMKKSILESGLLEEMEGLMPSEYLSGKQHGHNILARDIKEFISNMDTNSVDSIHLNKQAN